MSKRYDITILTSDRYLDPGIRDAESTIATSEHELLQEAMNEVGISSTIKSWSDRNFDWTTTRFAIFRTTWDYFEHLDRFILWMGRTSKKTQFINPFDLTQWNLDKHYLLDLKKRGLPVVPTVFLKPHERTTLKEVLEREGWQHHAILKPSISASSKHTYRLNENNIKNHESIFQRLLKSESLMVQPFIESIVSKGEISIVVIDGTYSHAVIKKPKFGDFRVQSDFGGTTEIFEPETEIINLAEKAVQCCPKKPLYARVDLVWGEEDQLLISELELIEPELFLRFKSEGARILAQSLRNYLDRN